MTINMEKRTLLDRWKAQIKKQDTVKNKISKAPEGVAIPLSRSQQRLWFLQQLYPDSSVYNYSELHKFTGNLDKKVLIVSIQSIFIEQDILRTYYVLENGKTYQRVDENLSLPVREFDFSTLGDSELQIEENKVISEEANVCFDLTKPPLVQCSLIKTKKTEHLLLVTMHHIITDKWSMGLFRKLLAEKYIQALNGTPDNIVQPDLQYTDYAYSQGRNGIDQNQVNYWLEKLSGEIPELDLPVDRPPSLQHSFAGNSHTQNFSVELSEKILRLCKQLAVTPYVFFLTAHYILLNKYTGQRDILIGSPISNRNEPILENMIGFFDETIVLRTEVDSSLTFMQLIAQVKKNTLEAFANKDIPFDLLVKKLKPERTLGRNPFFRSMFIYHQVPETPSFGPELELAHGFYDNKVSKFDLTLYVSNENNLLSSSIEYSTDLFELKTIERFQEHLKSLVEQIVSTPAKSIDKLDIRATGESEMLSNKPILKDGLFNSFRGIHEIILENARTRGTDIAVVFGNEQLTYSELKERAEIVALKVLKLTDGRKEIVGLCTNRSVDMIVGLIGILKAGCAYMPMDSEYPEKRISFMIADSGVKVIVTQRNQESFLASFAASLVFLDEMTDETETVRAEFLNHLTERNDLAYIIYTSGSTGVPKGVPITHSNIIGSTEGRLHYYSENPRAFLLMSSISFDSSKAGIFWTLCTGGKLVISESRLEQDAYRLAEVIQEQEISHTLMLPSLYESLLKNSDNQRLKTLSAVIVAGEACLPSTAKTHFEKLPGTKLYNEYGPTEATVWCTAHEIENGEGHSIPIGRPVANSRIYLLNSNLKPVPLGAIGEIYIGGPGLAISYLNNRELTDKVFVDNPFEIGTKIYKTGDLGRFNSNGELMFLGRVDQQIKIRGYRIELDEIKNALNDSPAVEKAVVVVEENRRETNTDLPENEPDKLLSYLSEYLSEKEIDKLLKSVENLGDSERDFLINQIQ